jgi:transcriptional regulator with XRE-family HTH domain
MSQQLFADRLGKSKSWVDKVERGVRRLDRFSVIYEIADVLQLDVQLLMGKDPGRREGASAAELDEVDEIRAALERYDKIASFYRPPMDAPTLPELSKAVGHAWLTYHHAKYGVLARMLPRLLRDAQAAMANYGVVAPLPPSSSGLGITTGHSAGHAAGVNSNGGAHHLGGNGNGNGGSTYRSSADSSVGTSREAARLLGQVYQIAASCLLKLGDADLAWLAADRAVPLCARGGDELLCGLAGMRVGMALTARGRHRPALELIVDLANHLAPPPNRPSQSERISVYGILLLQAAIAAARLDDAMTARDLLLAAEEAANALGRDANHYATGFGPTNVLIHTAASAIELGEPDRAVRIHEKIAPHDFAALMPERRAQHLLDLSRALLSTGNMVRAAEVLMEADRLAPAEIRIRPVAHGLVADLLRAARGHAPTPLTDLADVMGVTA